MPSVTAQRSVSALRAQTLRDGLGYLRAVKRLPEAHGCACLPPLASRSRSFIGAISPVKLDIRDRHAMSRFGRRVPQGKNGRSDFVGPIEPDFSYRVLNGRSEDVGRRQLASLVCSAFHSGPAIFQPVAKPGVSEGRFKGWLAYCATPSTEKSRYLAYFSPIARAFIYSGE